MESGKTTDDLDFHSNLTLQTMLNAGGDATAGYLKEQTGLDQTAQIHYRMDEWLIPLGLCRDAGETREYNGHESKVYELTADGEQYALDHNLDLAPELHRGQLEDAVGQLRDHLSAVNQNAQTANKNALRAAEQAEELAQRVEGFDGEVQRLGEKVNHAETRLNRLNDLLSNENLDNRVDDLDEEVEDLARRLEALEEQTGDAGTVAENLDAENLAEAVSKNREFIIDIWEVVGVRQFKRIGETVYSIVSPNSAGDRE